MKMPNSVQAYMIKGGRPKRADYSCDALIEDMWVLLESCWKEEANRRPSIEAIVQETERIRDALGYTVDMKV